MKEKNVKQFKLSIELVPEPLWYKNPRTMMPKSQWDHVRKQAYADYGHRCGICETEGRLEAHEIWEYDNERLVQKFKGLIALCLLCHQVKHIGRTGIMAGQGEIDMEAVIAHFMRVNDCTRQDFVEHARHAAELWRFRSNQKGWTVDWGPFQGLVRDT